MYLAQITFRATLKENKHLRQGQDLEQFALNAHTSTPMLDLTPGNKDHGKRQHQCTQRRFGCLEDLFSFLRGQKRVCDKGPEKGFLGKNTPIKVIHLSNNLKKVGFPQTVRF